MNSRAGEFVGAHTHRDTPVPIPNTAVKPVGPMILLQRESRSVPALNKNPSIERSRGSLLRELPLLARLVKNGTVVSSSGGFEGLEALS